jgi:magnesium and cobalt transporter
MSEDDSSTQPERRSWLDRIGAMLSGEPSTREDLVELLRDAQSDGLIAADTLRMMEGAIAVSDMTVGDVMIPRAQMVDLPADAKLLELMKRVVESGHSRFPVHGEDRDEILGILLAKDLLRGVVADNGPASVRELLRPAVLIPESKKLNVLLREFRQSRNHMAIVVDEYGGVAGLVTIEDVLEQIVGDIEDEYDLDDEEDNILAIKAGAYGPRWRVKALTELEQFNEVLGTDLHNADVDTIGGYLIDHLARVPHKSEIVESEGLRFEILRADARQIHVLLVEKLPPVETDDADDQ